MEQRLMCSKLSCSFETKRYPKEVKVADVLAENGEYCPECGEKLVYICE